MTFSRLLHPIEYSDAGMKATADAVMLARLYQAELLIVHARSRRVSKEHEAATHLHLRNFIAEMGISASTLQAAIVYGDPVEAVAEYAWAIAPDRSRTATSR